MNVSEQTTTPVIKQLDAFIRRYYKNQLIKGSIYTFVALLTLFLGIVLSEYFAYFPPVVRAAFFWGFIAVTLFAVVCYIVLPLLHMYRLGKVISYNQAAVIVGNHFPEIADKLLNYLQLSEMMSSAADTDLSPQHDLLQACIRQKTDQLSPFNFTKAVDLKKNRSYAKYLVGIVMVMILLMLFVPDAIFAPSRRITSYGTRFERPAPFAFTIESHPLATEAYADYKLVVSTHGKSVPREVFIQLPSGVYKMHQEEKAHFSYTIPHPSIDIPFSLQSAGVVSPQYLLHVYPQPKLVRLFAELTFPSYLSRPAERVDDGGNMVVPQGTVVKWVFNTRDVDTVYFMIDSLAPRKLCVGANDEVSVAVRAQRSFSYAFSVCNVHGLSSDTMRYNVSVVPDLPPEIAVDECVDSTAPDRRLFSGRISDDYGFSSLRFVVLKHTGKDTVPIYLSEERLSLSDGNIQEFIHLLDLSSLPLSLGESLSYYFEVCDNNGIAGPQCVRSREFGIEIPSERALQHTLEQNAVSAENRASAMLAELHSLQEDIDALTRKLIEKKELGWQEKRQLHDLYERQKDLRSALSQLQLRMKENSYLEKKYVEQSDELIAKQRELEKLMNEVLDEKTKKLLEDMENLLEQVDKNKVQEQLENIKLNSRELERQIDQDIDLMRRIELEKRVESAIHFGERLAERQRELSEKSAQGKPSQKESLQEEQHTLIKDFEELEKDIDAIRSEYRNIDKNAKFDVDSALINNVERLQKNAGQQLQKGNMQKAAERQRSAADAIERITQQMAESQQSIEQQNLAEDASMIRQMLKNLVHLSFDQEEQIKRVNDIYIQDPAYQKIISRQSVISSDFRMVEDTLMAVARRQVQVASAIEREISSVNINVTKSLSDLLTMNQSFYRSYKNSAASRSMQYAMTSLNNLSLILAESLDKMQGQMRSNQRKGSNKGSQCQGNCSNPGSGKPSPKSLRQMQDELNRQIEALKKQLDKDGHKSGEGRKRIGERSSVSEAFARMVAQQEAIRRLMQQYGQELKQQHAGDGQLAKDVEKILQQMEATETDLVNKTITQQTLMRQQQISTRLLEHEKAEMQREKEERRESHEATMVPHLSPSEIDYLRKIQRGSRGTLHSVPPRLTPFYRNKVQEYFSR